MQITDEARKTGQNRLRFVIEPEEYLRRISHVKRCSRCICGDDIPGITFNAQGMCNFCEVHDRLEIEYPTGSEGKVNLEKQFEEIRKAGKNKKYDSIIGVSGGCDSSYLVYLAKEYGLRPLAVHFDNTWNSTIATENIANVLSKCGVELYTHVVDNQEMNDLFRSFLRAGVPDADVPTDIGFASTLFRAARKYNIDYVIEGHSFRTEGIAPIGWIYMDGRYISGIHKRFGSQKLKTYPNMSLASFLYRLIISRTKKIRPLYNLDYRKDEVKELLQARFGWKWYGGHHLESRFTAFFHTYLWPKRFGFDDRLIELSALIRSGQISREVAEKEILLPRSFDPEIVDLVKKRLELSDAEFDRLMALPRRCYLDYPTNKQIFERLKPFFWLMYRSQLVPKSFYMKYCFPQERPAWAD